MKASIWFKALAVVLAIFTVGHTVGTRDAITTGPQEAAVIGAMQGYRVPVMGFERTYWEFYRGFSVFISVLLAALMVIAWQLGALSRRSPREALPLATTVLLACVAQAIASFVYFFVAPIILSLAAVICAAIATVLVSREAKSSGVRSEP